MSAAVYTTTITIKRPGGIPPEQGGATDPWERDDLDTPTVDESDPNEPLEIAYQVPADIGQVIGRGTGDTQTLEWPLICEPTDLRLGDTVVEDKTGQEYVVRWATLVPGLPGFEYLTAGLAQVSGFGNE